MHRRAQRVRHPNMHGETHGASDYGGMVAQLDNLTLTRSARHCYQSSIDPVEGVLDCSPRRTYFLALMCALFLLGSLFTLVLHAKGRGRILAKSLLHA